MPDDREVIRELLAGGPEAWDRFVRDHRRVVFKAVHAAAFRFRATAADVDDAAGQVFLELLEDDAKLLRGFQGKSALTTWLSVIVTWLPLQRIRIVPHSPAFFWAGLEGGTTP